MRKFFKETDNFFDIINLQLEDVKSIKQESSGWTNFVFIVSTKAGKFVFRFPRNAFFANALVKECMFLQQLGGKELGVMLPKLKLCYYKSKPYSVHEYIKGKSLSKAKLFFWQKKRIAKDIAEFLLALSKIKTAFKLPKTSTFLNQLSKVSDKQGYDIKKHQPLVLAEKQGLILTHGDLNPGNLIVKNGKLVAVVDFAFVSYSSVFNDVSRLLARCEKSFEKHLIKAFENKFNLRVDAKQICALQSVWQYVEKKYVEYIKLNHPDIILPKKFA